MTATASKRNYRASFILDNRGKEESVEQLIEGVKKVIAGQYVQIKFSAPASTPAALREKLRLNSSVYRTFIQSA